MIRRLGTHFVILVLLLVALGTARPSVFYVSRDATGANTGLSWQDAFTTIQAGIDAADSAGGGDVWVKSGIYSGFTSTPTTDRFELRDPRAVDVIGEERNFVLHLIRVADDMPSHRPVYRGRALRSHPARDVRPDDGSGLVRRPAGGDDAWPDGCAGFREPPEYERGRGRHQDRGGGPHERGECLCPGCHGDQGRRGRREVGLHTRPSRRSIR